MAADKYAPDSLKYQWRLYALVSRSDWATGLDKSISFEIIDNYRKEFGNSRASLSYLQQATGAKRSNVTASLRRICENGPISVARPGIGTRPTEYKLHFNLVGEKPSSPAQGTSSDDCSSSPVEATTGSPVEATSSKSSSPVEGTQTVLPVTAYKAGLQERTIDSAAPSAPLADGLSATAAETAEDAKPEPFEQLWKTYGVRKKKADARAAYDKLAPDAGLHATMIASAKAWRDAAGDSVERMHLRRWIEQEEYECEPPSAFKAKDKPRRATARSPTQAANTVADEVEEPLFEWVGDVSAFVPVGKHAIEIKAADSAADDDGNPEVTLVYDVDDDDICIGDVEHRFFIEHKDEKLQRRGQDHLNKLTAAAGIVDIEDTADLVGARVVAVVGRDGSVRYEPVGANDNAPAEAEVAA
ncbi:hypothetical protein [Nitratireductor sp. GCM10026969]|uniref:hypothetical protein n=1 Tax=Nitratireductor sp. GCM10026969 TaxID=3252645 RepID=UPI003609139F